MKDKHHSTILLLPFFLIIVALAFTTMHQLPTSITGTEFNMMLVGFMIFIPFVMYVVFYLIK